MKLLKKIISFFIKAKNVALTTYEKIDPFIKEHKKQIKLLMTVLEAIFPAKTGARKMACVVSNVCLAVGCEEYTEDVLVFIQDKCQKIYDEFKEGLNDNLDAENVSADSNEA